MDVTSLLVIKLQLRWFIEQHLKDLRDAFYKEESEATCRIAVDIILIQCRKYVRLKYNPAKADAAALTTPSTPMKGVLNVPIETPKQRIKSYPDSTISVEVPDQSIPTGKLLVSGRADWAMGYSSDEDGALLAVVVAKRRSEWTAGE